MTTVRLHLRLSVPERAESVLCVPAKKDEKGSSAALLPEAAYVSSYILKNVRPVVVEGTQSAPTACLEGELVAWQGRFCKGVDAKTRKKLEKTKVADLFNDVSVNHYNTLQDGPRIGYNPRKSKEFFEVPVAGENIRMAFVGAGSVVGCHWHIAARDAVFRPLAGARTSVPRKVRRRSSYDLFGVGKAMNTTSQRLATYGISL